MGRVAGRRPFFHLPQRAIALGYFDLTLGQVRRHPLVKSAPGLPRPPLRHRHSPRCCPHYSRLVVGEEFLRSVAGLGRCGLLRRRHEAMQGSPVRRRQSAGNKTVGKSGLTSDLPRVVVGLIPDYVRKAGLNHVSTGACSSDVRAATNFRGAEKSRVWLGGRYSMARWRNGSSQGFHYRA